MQGFPSRQLPSAEVEWRIKAGERSQLCLLVGILGIDDFQQFLSQHGAHAGAVLGGKDASPFEKRFVDGESDVLLQEDASSFRVKSVNRAW
jgi:hypothetical protein